MDRARTALAEAAAEARPMQFEIIAQRIEQRHVGVVDRYRDRLAVDIKGFGYSHETPPLGSAAVAIIVPRVRRTGGNVIAGFGVDQLHVHPKPVTATL